MIWKSQYLPSIANMNLVFYLRLLIIFDNKILIIKIFTMHLPGRREFLFKPSRE
jgi:hypothetical protein